MCHDPAGWMSPGWIERNMVNRAVRTGVLLGCDIDGVRTLEVIGRRTGRPRRTPVKVLNLDGRRYVVSLYGESGWARNLRQERRARIIFGRQGETVIGVELPPDERSPILQAYRAAAARAETRRILEEDAANLPVFRLDAG
jgi:deazaflavin-dependent oxidoreductase (nitroreductase family)